MRAHVKDVMSVLEMYALERTFLFFCFVIVENFSILAGIQVTNLTHGISALKVQEPS